MGLSWALFILALSAGGASGQAVLGSVLHSAAVLAATASLGLALSGVWTALREAEAGPLWSSHLHVGIGVIVLALVAMPFTGRWTLALGGVQDRPGSRAAQPAQVTVDDDVFAPASP